MDTVSNSVSRRWLPVSSATHFTMPSRPSAMRDVRNVTSAYWGLDLDYMYSLQRHAGRLEERSSSTCTSSASTSRARRSSGEASVAGPTSSQSTDRR